MYRTILTLTFMTTLALATLCDASPRTRQPPPRLTPEETLCYAFGEVTYDLAIARDAGYTVLQATSIMRGSLQGPLNTPAMGQLLTDVVQAIYQYRRVKPEAVREAYTLACVQEHLFAIHATTGVATKERY